MIHKNQKLKSQYHILFIVENNPVPQDIRVWREAKVALKCGFNVSIICPISKVYKKNFEKLEGIKIYRHWAYINKGGVIGQLTEYMNAFFWETILSIRIFMRYPFQVIHAANPPDNIFLIALGFKILGVKYIFDHHDLSPELYKMKYDGRRNALFIILRYLERLSCKFSDIIISTNNSFKKHVVKNHNVNPNKVYVVRNDPEFDSTQKFHNLKKFKNPAKTLLYVGAINKQDGVDLLVRIINILVNDIDERNFYCNIIGNGTEIPYLKILVKVLGLTDYINFMGYITNRRILKKYILEATVGIETAPDSDANRKSTFIKIMEYMEAGKPIVAFDLCETRYTVGDTAILIEPGNLYGFAKELKKILNNSEKQIILGRSARKRIETKLNWEKAANTLQSIYSYLL